MSKPTSSLLTLLIHDQGALVLDASGQLLGQIPDAKPGAERRHAWASALRGLDCAGADVQLVLAQAELDIECQDVPFLNRREIRDVATRTAAARGIGFDAVAALDADEASEAGHVLWVATQPHADMADWCQAIAAAGLSIVYAVPFQRILLQGVDTLGDLPQDRIILALGLGSTAHLVIYQGRSLQVLRSFQVPDGVEEAEELFFGEVNRLLQFFKQKHRTVRFDHLLVVGSAGFSSALVQRFQSALKLAPRYLSPLCWSTLEAGLRVERSRSDGLNLVPIEIQEALRRSFFKGVVWLSALAMFTLLGGASFLILRQEREMRDQVQQAEALVAQRMAMAKDDEVVIQKRLPLLRMRLSEDRQAKAIRSVARISTVILEAPEGIVLEKVEVTEAPEGATGHRFTISGLAYTDAIFSVGPLARYLRILAAEPGVQLAPVREIKVSDRMQEGDVKLDQRAVTRFTLEGTAP
jgi:hypothetical protein